MAVQLSYGEAKVLYHEPEGLLLRVGLVRFPSRHAALTALAFQLSYTGSGCITVDVVPPSGRGEGTAEDTALMSVRLEGVQERPDAAAWTSIVEVGASSPVRLWYTVLGQPGDDDPLRVRLDSEISGVLPCLTATTSVGLCLQPFEAEASADGLDEPAGLTL